MKLKDISLAKRLGFGFATVLTLLCVILALASSQLAQLAKVQAASTETTRQIGLALEWQALTQLNVTRRFAVQLSGGNALAAEYFGQPLDATVAKINELRKALDATELSEDEVKKLAEVDQARKTYQEVRDKVMAANKAEPDGAEARMKNDLLPALVPYMASMDALVKQLRANGVTETELAQQEAVATQAWLLAIGALALTAGVAAAVLLTRSVTQPMREVTRSAEAIAAGDLSATLAVDRGDEIGQLQQAMKSMRDNLHAMVSGIRTSTEGITTASSEIAAGAQDLSGRTEQTASNLQEAAASMEQLTGTVRQTADSARTANQLASTAAGAAERGGQVVHDVVQNMQEISQASRKIADIIGVIDGIAFQTNILALNAAVEAARAGEQGRGFAVVAGEVRSLAGRSAEAAREIKTLIGASVERVESGARLVESAGSSMQDIVGSVQRVSDIIGEISAATAEQSDGIAQVNRTVVNLDQMTQQNAALVEESAAAAESLKDQAQRLVGVVGRFRLDGSAPQAAPAAHAAAAKPAKAAASATKSAATAPRPAPAAPKSAAPAVPVTAKAAPAASPKPAAPASPAPSPAMAATTAAGDSDWETF